MRITRSVMHAKPYPQVHSNDAITAATDFTESRTFDIDVSAGGSHITTKEFTVPRSALGPGTGAKTIDIDLILRRRRRTGGGGSGSVVTSTTNPAARASGPAKRSEPRLRTTAV
ncbi:unnamed protein product [Discula destructiva]